MMEGIWKHWKHFSGDHSFPVPYASGSAQAKYHACGSGDLWARSSDEDHNLYVQRRYELLNFLIESTKPATSAE